MPQDKDDTGGAAPVPGSQHRDRRSRAAYRAGRQACLRKSQDRVWFEPHYPVADAELELAWLDGWSDMEEELRTQASPRR